jgi:L-amino acid N-acyltransferase YncA
MSRHICKKYKIIPMTREHWPSVSQIYLEGITGGHATFETAVPAWDHWDAAHHTFARLVVLVDQEVKGWAALSRSSPRKAYDGVADVTIYVGATTRGQGFGHALLEALIPESESCGIWTLQAGIFPENVASIKLHQRFGFREVGRRERIGKLNGAWRDTVLMERRSGIVGTD